MSAGAARCRRSLEEAANEYFGVVDRHRRLSARWPSTTANGRWPPSCSRSIRTTMGVPPVPIDEIAEGVAANADVLIAFGTVAHGPGGRAGGRAASRRAHVKGFKFHPNTQAFHPNDRMAYLIYEAIAERGLISLFHTGQTGIGAGARGGGGIKLKYSNPMDVDDVAADFPDMPIILAHPSFPWQDEALAVATHKPQVYIDLSGWSPKYFPPNLVRYANTLLQDKVLVSDFPLITPDRWLRDFDTLEIKPEVKPKILKTNAARLLACLGGSPPPRSSSGDTNRDWSGARVGQHSFDEVVGAGAVGVVLVAADPVGLGGREVVALVQVVAGAKRGTDEVPRQPEQRRAVRRRPRWRRGGTRRSAAAARRRRASPGSAWRAGCGCRSR